MLLVCHCGNFSVKRAIHLADVESIGFCPAGDKKNVHFLINFKEGTGEVSFEFETEVDHEVNRSRNGVWHSILAINDARSRFRDDLLPVTRYGSISQLRKAGNFNKANYVPYHKQPDGGHQALRATRKPAVATPLGQATLRRAADMTEIKPVMTVPDSALRANKQPPITIFIQRATPDTSMGLTVNSMVLVSVVPNSAAALAGAEDCIGLSLTHCNGELVKTLDELKAAASGGASFSLTFGLRNEVQVSRVSPTEDLGLNYDIVRNNIVITKVMPESACHRAGVQAYVGECLTHINGQRCAPNKESLGAMVTGQTEMTMRFGELDKEPVADELATISSPRAPQSPTNANYPPAFAPQLPQVPQAPGTPVATAMVPEGGGGMGGFPEGPSPASGLPSGTAPALPGAEGQRAFTVRRATPQMSLGLKYNTFPNNGKELLAVRSVVQGSASQESGLGALFEDGHEYAITSVDGVPIGNETALKQLCEGKTTLNFVFDRIPPEVLDPLLATARLSQHSATNPTVQSFPNEDPNVIVRANPGEPVGLNLEDFCVSDVVAGSPAERCGFARHIGKRVATINGVPVRTIQEAQQVAEGASQLRYTFEDVSAKPAPPLPPPRSPPQHPTLAHHAPPPSLPPSDTEMNRDLEVIDQGFVMADDEIEEVNPQGSGGAYASVMHSIAQLVDRQSRTEEMLVTLLSSLQNSNQTAIADRDSRRRERRQNRALRSASPESRIGLGSASASGRPEPQGAMNGAMSYFQPSAEVPVFHHPGGGRGAGGGGGGGYPPAAYSPQFGGGSPRYGGGGGGGSASGYPHMTHFPRGEPLPSAQRGGTAYDIPSAQRGGGVTPPGNGVQQYNKIEIDLNAGKVMLM